MLNGASSSRQQLNHRVITMQLWIKLLLSIFCFSHKAGPGLPLPISIPLRSRASIDGAISRTSIRGPGNDNRLSVAPPWRLRSFNALEQQLAAGGGPSSVPLDSDPFGLILVGEIGVGGTSFPLLMDTGSSDIWLNGTREDTELSKKVFSSYGKDCCASGKCCGSDSCSAMDWKHHTLATCGFHIEYVSGAASGTLGVASAVFGQQNIGDIQLGLGTLEDPQLREVIPGILGLGFPILASFTKPTLVDVLSEFTFKLTGEKALLLGHVNTAGPGNSSAIGSSDVSLPSTLQWLDVALKPVTTTAGVVNAWWSVTLSKVKTTKAAGQSEDEVVVPEIANRPVIFDSGTSLVVIPLNDLNILISSILPKDSTSPCKKISCGSASATNMYGCTSLDNLRKLTLFFGDGNASLSVTPEQYSLRHACPEMTYTLVFAALDGKEEDDVHGWLVGMGFLKNFPYIKHDAAARTISFAIDPEAARGATKEGNSSTGNSKAPSSATDDDEPLKSNTDGGVNLALVIAVAVSGSIIVGLAIAGGVWWWAMRRERRTGEVPLNCES